MPMMADNTPREVVYVPEYMIGILMELRRSLELYQNVRKYETELIELLTKEIERISEEGQGNFFIETMISEYEYPRFFEEEYDLHDFYDVEQFNLGNRSNTQGNS
jgi:hypothetical protein